MKRSRASAQALVLAGAFASSWAALWAPPGLAQAQLTGSVRLHDPSRIQKVDDRYYLYATGDNIASKYSDDLVHWVAGPAVFSAPPAWTQTAVPGFNRTFWAPDVLYLNDRYHLYYSVSTFGSQRSAIGLATNSTLNPADPDYEWVDQGAVIQSQPGSAYNTIDPGVFLDDDGRMWMTFGSFWSGVYIAELDPATGKRVSAPPPATRLAQNVPSTQIEAPYLHKRDDAYYLFVNWGTCCQGVNSTYNIRVGRGTSPTGPFYDKSGVNMTGGGGSLFLQTQGDFVGPGHLSIFEENGVEYFSYHYYDRDDSGRSKLNLRPLDWTPDGWPIVADELAGDFNSDGVVDRLDLTQWTNDFGTNGAANSDGDSDVDGADFLVWQRQLGARLDQALDAGAAPEPGTGLLLAVGMAAAERARRRRTHGPRRRRNCSDVEAARLCTLSATARHRSPRRPRVAPHFDLRRRMLTHS